LQEQQHHHKHQDHCLHQGYHHFLDGNTDKQRGVEGHKIVDPIGQEARQLIELGAHTEGGIDGIAAGSGLHGDTHSSASAIAARYTGVLLGAQFDAGHIPEAHRGTIDIGAQDNIAKFLFTGQLAADHHHGGNGLVCRIGSVANTAR